MGDQVKDAWSEVAEGFAKLGQAIRDGYLGEGPPGGARPHDPADTGLRDALERFVAAGRDIGQRTATMVRDIDVNAQAKQAASSLNDALSATVDMIGREVAGWFERHERPAATGDAHPELDEAPKDGPPVDESTPP